MCLKNASVKMPMKSWSLAAELNVIQHAEARKLQLNVYKMSDLARLRVQHISKTKTKQGMWNDSSYFRDLKIKHSKVYL
jgi:hypothetical protein